MRAYIHRHYTDIEMASSTAASQMLMFVRDENGNYQAVLTTRRNGNGKTCVRVDSFGGAQYVNVRDYFTSPAGAPQPTKRGVNLTVDEWRCLCANHSPVAEAAHSRSVGTTIQVTRDVVVAVQPKERFPNSVSVVISKSRTSLDGEQVERKIELSPATWKLLTNSTARQQVDFLTNV